MRHKIKRKEEGKERTTEQRTKHELTHVTLASEMRRSDLISRGEADGSMRRGRSDEDFGGVGVPYGVQSKGFVL